MMKNRLPAWVYLILIAISVLVFLIATGFAYAFLAQNKPRTKIVLTSGLSEANLPIDELETFSPEAELIYCFIELRGLLMGNRIRRLVLVKWYSDSEQIASHYLNTSTSKPTVVWLDSPDDKPFEQGSYSVEVIAPPRLLKTIEFRVE